MADTNPSTEDDIDGCGHEISAAETTPDEDLPVAVGGVE